MNIETASRHR